MGHMARGHPFGKFAVHSPSSGGPDAAIASVQSLLDLWHYTERFGDRDDPMRKLTDYVLTAEAAEILGVSQNTLRKWAEAGKVSMHRNPANGYRLFRRADLQEFLRAAAQRVRPAQAKKTK